MTSDALLKILQSKKLIDEALAARLARESSLSGRSVDDIIHSQRTVNDEVVAQAKAEALGVPYKKIDIAALTPEVLRIIPEETVRTYGVVPLEKKEDLLVVGMIAPDDAKAQEALRFIARRDRINLGAYVISYGDWQSALDKYSPYQSKIEEAVKTLNIKAGSGRKLIELGAGGGAEDAPIIRIVEDSLKEAVQKGASDVHIEPQENYLRVRFRLGGDLVETASLPIELAQPVISRVKVMSQLRIDETRTPQDGRFRTKIFEREIDFRVATFPTPSGEKVAIRVLDPKTGLKTLNELGLIGRNLDVVKEGVEKPFGMVLISGPTGSGKTTTLYAILQFLNNESVNIVSLEDPVEYFISGVNQSQVRPEIGYDFASGLREILRQDPDIIMVGEIRDNETSGLAVHAALTGHIVLSTIHTNDALGVVPRLVDMKVDSFLLPSALNLMIAQRLVPMVCPDCKKQEEASAPLQKVIAEALEGLSADLKGKYRAPYVVYRGAGCASCGGKGVKGRMAVYEVFRMTPELADALSAGVTRQKLVAEARRQGMITMRQDGVLKALEGTVPIEAVLRETAEE